MKRASLVLIALALTAFTSCGATLRLSATAPTQDNDGTCTVPVLSNSPAGAQRALHFSWSGPVSGEDSVATTAGSPVTYTRTVPTKREGLTQQEQTDVAFRVLADHARTISCAIADGILPGNEGRNYVLRKIMRRAIYHGREHLGLKDAFFYKVCDLVVVVQRHADRQLRLDRSRCYVSRVFVERDVGRDRIPRL